MNTSVPLIPSKKEISETPNSKSKSRNYIVTHNFQELFQVEVSKEPNLDKFKSKPVYGIWKWEKGEKNQTIHWHCYIEFANPIAWTTVKKIFPLADIRVRRGTQAQVIKYIRKEKTSISEPKEYGIFTEDKQGARTDIDELKKDIYEFNYDLAQIKEKHFGLYLRYSSAIDKMIMTRSLPLDIRKIEDFKFPRLELDLPILLTGMTNTGKTSFALSHFINPLLVRHIEDLRKFTNLNDGIVFDDMTFKHWPPESVIHLLDIDYDSSIHARFQNVFIPKGTKRIFVHNDEDIFYVAEIPESQKSAIERRYNSVYVSQDLRNPFEAISKKRPRLVL